jgi:ribonuclease HII
MRTEINRLLLKLGAYSTNRHPTDKVYGKFAGVNQTSLADIKRHYVLEGRPLEAATEAALRADPRPGARSILQAIARRRFENRAEGQRLRKLTRFEQAFWDKGILQVAGVDEAGMSPLAGPVSAAAVIFLPGARIPSVDDSKKLNASERERLSAEIKRTAVAWSVGFAEVSEIDTINIYWASQLAMKRAVTGLLVRPAHVLVDGRRIKDMESPKNPSSKAMQAPP